jgi:heme A synthase
MTLDRSTPGAPRWLHALAVLTVLLTLPLLFLGAGVTSHGVGMVDPQGFRTPWDIINGFLQDSGFGLRLEYGHRTFGFLVGLCGIGLAVGCWFFDRRPWMGWLGFLALGLICTQGALGIFRVDYNALYGRTFALIHGVFAQVVFAVLVSVALLTSRRWLSDRSESASPAVQRWSIVVMLLVFGQLLLGGLVRHEPDSLLGPRGHMLGAFVVVGAVVWLLMLIRDSESRERFKMQRILLMTLLTLQLVLGMESWLSKFFVDGAINQQQLLPVPMHALWIRTAHYLTGTLIFATTVAVALIAQHKPALVTEAVPARSRELEGVL